LENLDGEMTAFLLDNGSKDIFRDLEFIIRKTNK